MNVNISFWCERVRECFVMFKNHPNTLQHLLLFGPPGSGKTTSAAWLVEQIWGNRKSVMCISMNAADERSLESIRQKVFPFLRVDWRTEEEKSPRFLILDECETLTEAAQLSLQTILNHDPKELCVILICNSQSRIHIKLRQRLIKIRYDPLYQINEVNSLFTAIVRGDLRQYSHKKEIEERLWIYINGHPSDYEKIIKSEKVDYHMIMTEILILTDMFEIMDDTILYRINIIYPLITDNIYLYEEIEIQMIKLMNEFKENFELKIKSKLI